MNVQFFIIRLIITTALFGTIDALAQNAAVTATSGLPDACKLVLRSDLEALFPGMPIKSERPTLSPIFQGPQYNESCIYNVWVPSPIAKFDQIKFISLKITKCDVCDLKDKSTAAEVLAGFRDFADSGAKAKPSLMQVEPLSEIGDDAFQVTDPLDVKIYVRKADLVFFLSVTKYSRQTQPNAVALAKQAAKRWRGGVGMVEAATPIATNSSVDLPPDTRISATESADKWPNACALLTPEDVRTVFGDMTIDPQEKIMGEIIYSSRVSRVEKLPNPIGCRYYAHKTTMVDGERQVIANTIDLKVKDVATSVDFAKQSYGDASRVAHADTVVSGVGDEASIDIINNIYIRKGVLTVAVHVSGGERDQALYADARRRVNEIAKLVVAKLP